MNILWWALIGFAAGAIAKLITKQEEKGGWITSLGVGLVGSMVGGFLSRFIPFTGFLRSNLIGELAIAVGGSLLVLWVYHKYLKEKMNINL